MARSLTVVEQKLGEIVDLYPAEMRADQANDAPRITWHLQVLTDHTPPGGYVVDIGGGIGLMSPGAAALGFKSVLVDDFRDPVNERHPIHDLGVHGALGVRIISTDVVEAPPTFEPGSIDAVTCFESMEHWHNSPKGLFHGLADALKPGGVFFLGVPNCVDIRMRLTVPLGRAKWSAMEDWYEQPKFRGHVREPDLDDLRYIARDLGLIDCRYFGKNWQAHTSRRKWVRSLAPLLARPLEAFPGLCSDIYLLGRKPA